MGRGLVHRSPPSLERENRTWVESLEGCRSQATYTDPSGAAVETAIGRAMIGVPRSGSLGLKAGLEATTFGLDHERPPSVERIALIGQSPEAWYSMNVSTSVPSRGAVIMALMGRSSAPSVAR